ncbi:glutaredoxin family protein [Streptomyces radicis]
MGAMTPLLRRPDRDRGEGGRRTGRARAAAGERPPSERLVTLIGKPGCHLCDDARRVVAAVCDEVGAAWEERDITRDAELHRLYQEQIPVVLIDGAQHDFWRVDAGRLKRALGA